MIEFSLTAADTGRIRFGHSTMWELVASLQVLRDRRRHSQYGSWVARTLPRVDGVDLGLLTSLAHSDPDLVALLAPAPSGLSGTLADELAGLLRNLPSQIRERPRTAGSPAPDLRAFYGDPQRHLPRLVDQIRRYWSIALAPEWPRIERLVIGDVSYRVERLSRSGIAPILDELHPSVLFTDDRLTLRVCGDRRVEAAGRGVVLVPCVFGAPVVRWAGDARTQPVLAYPARGRGALLSAVSPDLDGVLDSLVGRTRAVLLDALDVPCTTTQLARDLDLSAAAVSQHLKILKDSALVDRWRRGRQVLYLRTDAGTALLNAARVG